MRAVLLPFTDRHRTIDVDLGDVDVPPDFVDYDLPDPDLARPVDVGGVAYVARPVTRLRWAYATILPGCLAVYTPVRQPAVDAPPPPPEHVPPLHLVVDEATRGVPARRPDAGTASG